MDVSVVVPVRDEADNIISFILEIRGALDGVVAYELIYVDDGSTDATPQRLAHVRQRILPALRVIRHREPCGQSTAIWTGVKAARAAWIVTLDGDGQNDPADIPRLLETLRQPDCAENLQLVVGLRRTRMDSWLRRVSSRIANGVRGRVLHDHTPDTGCGLKLISREVFMSLPYFDHMHRFLAALVLRSGGAVMSVDVTHRPRAAGRSHYGVNNRLWAGIIDMLGVLWLQHRTRIPAVEAQSEE